MGCREKEKEKERKKKKKYGAPLDEPMMALEQIKIPKPVFVNVIDVVTTGTARHLSFSIKHCWVSAHRNDRISNKGNHKTANVPE